MVEGDLSRLVLQAKLSFYLFFFLISTLSFYEEPSFSAPLFFSSPVVPWSQSHALRLDPPTEPRRAPRITNGGTEMYRELSPLCQLSLFVPLFSQLSDV